MATRNGQKEQKVHFKVSATLSKLNIEGKERVKLTASSEVILL